MTAEPLKILLLGGTGQVGRELRRRPWPMPVALAAPGRDEIDLADPHALRAAVARHAPAILVNAAAFTAVDAAETDPAAAHAVNAAAPSILAAAAAKAGAAILHLSTDYVFDGRKPGPYVEDDPVAPLSVYGSTKAAGEAAVRAACPRHVILRTSWVYAPAGRNFVLTMLRLGAERPLLRIVDDQRGAPTAAADIADTIMAIARQIAVDEDSWGTFHFTAAGATSWYGFARAIFALAAAAGRPVPHLEPVTTADYPTPARRPSNSRLDCARIGRAYGIVPRDWQAALADTTAELFARGDGGT
ncbi:MAG: dTDP-4-dehydrorhamnose reductase [Alphaproteobacteria bacterium]